MNCWTQFYMLRSSCYSRSWLRTSHFLLSWSSNESGEQTAPSSWFRSLISVESSRITSLCLYRSHFVLRLRVKSEHAGISFLIVVHSNLPVLFGTTTWLFAPSLRFLIGDGVFWFFATSGSENTFYYLILLNYCRTMPLAILFDFMDFFVCQWLVYVSVAMFLVGVSKEARCSALDAC